MPHLDVIDEMRNARDRLLRVVEKHAGKRGASLIHDSVVSEFGQLIEHADDERKEWEKVLNFLMERESEEDAARE